MINKKTRQALGLKELKKEFYQHLGSRILRLGDELYCSLYSAINSYHEGYMPSEELNKSINETIERYEVELRN